MRISILVCISAISLLVGAMTASAQETDQTEAAWQSWHAGEISDAHDSALQALSLTPADERARHLIILTSFLIGDYEESIAEFELLYPEYEDYETLTRVVLDAYLHLGRYGEAASFAERMSSSENERIWLASRAENPLTVALDSTTVIPFAEDNWLGDLMPAIPIELNGKPYLGHLDTGGDFIATSPKMVEELGIEVSPIGTGVANNQPTTIEPYRVYRRLHFMRGWGHGKGKEVLTGGSRASGADGFGPRGGVFVQVVGDPIDCGEDWLLGRDPTQLGPPSRA